MCVLHLIQEVMIYLFRILKKQNKTKPPKLWKLSPLLYLSASIPVLSHRGCSSIEAIKGKDQGSASLQGVSPCSTKTAVNGATEMPPLQAGLPVAV